MKKLVVNIMALCCIFSILFFSRCSAKIYEKKDSFDGTALIYSQTDGRDSKPFTQILLSQNILIFNLVKYEWWFFSADDIDVKFNGENEIYKWPVYSTDSSMKRGRNLSYLRTTCNIVLTEEMQEQIKNSSKVSFRIRFKNQPSIIYNVPEKTLEEWKQVINMDK